MKDESARFVRGLIAEARKSAGEVSVPYVLDGLLSEIALEVVRTYDEATAYEVFAKLADQTITDNMVAKRYMAAVAGDIERAVKRTKGGNK